jgi:5-methylcytosine-specific restriction endonuclease McrA
MATRRGDPRSQRRYKEVRLLVLARDQWTCYYCHSPEATTVDHIHPVSKMENKEDAYDPELMVACCKRCNSSKGSRSQAVFLARTATPPVFKGISLPETQVTRPLSPFEKP